MKIGMIGNGKLANALMDEITENHKDITTNGVFYTGTRNVPKNVFHDIDVVVHCGRKEYVVEDAELCIDHGKPVVIATTGWDDIYLSALKYVVRENDGKVLYSPNFSKVVRAFYEISEFARNKLVGLGLEKNIRIYEHHGEDKRDTHSGTAYKLRDLLGRPDTPISSTRLGKDVFDHEVLFSAQNNFISIKHSARDRAAYAKGIIDACHWILNNGKKGVVYSDEVLYN